MAITRMIHDRYHPARRNPWNEVECSDHYARAMASYGVFLAATPKRSPWVSIDDIKSKGAIVLWPTTDTAGTPPEAIKQDLPFVCERLGVAARIGPIDGEVLAAPPLVAVMNSIG